MWIIKHRGRCLLFQMIMRHRLVFIFILSFGVDHLRMNVLQYRFRWIENVLLTKFSSLPATEVAIFTSAASDQSVVEMTFSF